MVWLLRGPPSQGFYQHFPYDTGSMVSQSAKELIDPSQFILFDKEVVQLRPQDLQILQAWKHYLRWFWMYNFFTCPPEQLLSYKNVLSSDQRPAWWVYIYILYYQWYTHISYFYYIFFGLLLPSRGIITSSASGIQALSVAATSWVSRQWCLN